MNYETGNENVKYTKKEFKELHKTSKTSSYNKNDTNNAQNAQNDNNNPRISDYLNTNVIRRLVKSINNSLDYVNCAPGEFYYLAHYIMIIGIVIILMFNTNLLHLSCILLILCFDGLSAIALHDCPITILERKYLDTCSTDERTNLLKQCGINYNCSCQYEKTLESIINTTVVCFIKIIMLIIFKTFRITPVS